MTSVEGRTKVRNLFENDIGFASRRLRRLDEFGSARVGPTREPRQKADTVLRGVGVVRRSRLTQCGQEHEVVHGFASGIRFMPTPSTRLVYRRRLQEQEHLQVSGPRDNSALDHYNMISSLVPQR